MWAKASWTVRLPVKVVYGGNSEGSNGKEAAGVIDECDWREIVVYAVGFVQCGTLQGLCQIREVLATLGKYALIPEDANGSRRKLIEENERMRAY